MFLEKKETKCACFGGSIDFFEPLQYLGTSNVNVNNNLYSVSSYPFIFGVSEKFLEIRNVVHANYTASVPLGFPLRHCRGDGKGFSLVNFRRKRCCFMFP